MFTNEQIVKLYEQTGALQEGHFRLSSGLHSPRYLQAALLLQYPPIAQELGWSLGQLFKDEKIALVVAPAVGGILLGQEVARALKCRANYLERERGDLRLRRGFKIEPQDRVLVVEDVITTGGSVKETIEVVKAKGGEIVGVAVLIDRSGGKAKVGYPYKALAQLEIPAYKPEDCPLCKKGVPTVTPGSRGLA